jgi:phosphoribosylaminoimidazole carboxylase
MPRRVPVAAVAINNSLNAALLAVRILGASDVRLREKIEAFAEKNRVEVQGKDQRLVEIGWEAYLEGMGK